MFEYNAITNRNGSGGSTVPQVTRENPFTVPDEYGNRRAAHVSVSGFQTNGLGLCLTLCTDTNQLVSTLTFDNGPYLDNGVPIPKNCGWVDTKSMPHVEQFIQQTGLGRPVVIDGKPIVVQYEFEHHPLYQFNPEKLCQMDPKGYDRYSKGYASAYRSEMSYLKALQLNQFEDNDDDDYDPFLTPLGLG